MPAPSTWTARPAAPSAPTRLRSALRRAPGRWAITTVLPAVALGLTLARSDGNQDANAQGAVVAAGAGHQAIASAPDHRADDDASASPRFAAVDGVNLHLTSRTAMLVGFHEASFADALRMLPVGERLASDNGGVHHVTSDGPNFVVMSSRGRPTAPTSAVDIAQQQGAPVLSPVDGTVTAVRSYSLYGRYPDTRIEIAPTGRPDLRVVVLHVSGSQVGVGSPVVAGRTPIAASATSFPFSSHIDRYAGGRPPHVHVEVKRVSPG